MIPPCSVMPDASLMPSAARYWDRILGGLSRMDTNPRIATRTAISAKEITKTSAPFRIRTIFGAVSILNVGPP